MSQGPPKPRFSLTVGILGHRPNRLPAEVVELVTAQMSAALQAIRKSAADAHQRYVDCFLKPSQSCRW